jgi:hypothetical protein
MATHEYWQFAFVREVGINTRAVSALGFSSPLKVEVSNLPVGSIPLEEQPNMVVMGDHLRILYSLPYNPFGFTLTGKIKILKKSKEFPRGHLDSQAEIVLSDDLTGTQRNTYLLHLDHEVVGNQFIWYYTAFYEAVDSQGVTTWIFSPINGHDRGLPLSSSPSQFGGQLFNYFPRGIRIKDKSEADDTLFRLSNILGKPLDEIKERLAEFSENRNSPHDVDASLIPYIDGLLGWPTNFELSELRRRNETIDAVNIWKSKGTNDAFELTLQRITGWNVELYEGYNHVVTTATSDDALDPNNAPVGWQEPIDGVWADQFNNQPFNGTPDLSNPLDPNYLLSPLSRPFRVIHDGTDWVNIFGVLIHLTSPLSNGSPLLRELAQEKIDRLLDYLAIHYANFKIQVANVYNESLILNASDSFSDEYIRGVDESGELDIVESISDASNTGVLYTYPHSDASETNTNITWSSTAVGNIGRIFHNVMNQGI